MRPIGKPISSEEQWFTTLWSPKKQLVSIIEAIERQLLQNVSGYFRFDFIETARKDGAIPVTVPFNYADLSTFRAICSEAERLGAFKGVFCDGDNRAHFFFDEPDNAMLFKLTYGGER